MTDQQINELANESILAFIVAVAVGVAILFTFSRWIGRIKLTLANAFWGSAIGHLLQALVNFGLGFTLREHLAIAFLVGLIVMFLFQTVLFQLLARTQDEVLLPWRAAFIALIVIVADFVIVSPIVGLIYGNSV